MNRVSKILPCVHQATTNDCINYTVIYEGLRPNLEYNYIVVDVEVLVVRIGAKQKKLFMLSSLSLKLLVNI